MPSSEVGQFTDGQSDERTKLKDLGVPVQLLHGHLSVEADASENCEPGQFLAHALMS